MLVGVDLVADPVEDAVHELARFFGGVEFGDLDRLVDADVFRDVGEEFHLEDREAQDVPVDRRHAGDAPVVGVLADQAVDRVEVLQHPVDEGLGVADHLHLVVVHEQGEIEDVLDRLLGLEVSLVEDRHGENPGVSANAHAAPSTDPVPAGAG